MQDFQVPAGKRVRVAPLTIDDLFDDLLAIVFSHIPRWRSSSVPAVCRRWSKVWIGTRKRVTTDQLVLLVRRMRGASHVNPATVFFARQRFYPKLEYLMVLPLVGDSNVKLITAGALSILHMMPKTVFFQEVYKACSGRLFMSTMGIEFPASPQVTEVYIGCIMCKSDTACDVPPKLDVFETVFPNATIVINDTRENHAAYSHEMYNSQIFYQDTLWEKKVAK